MTMGARAYAGVASGPVRLDVTRLLQRWVRGMRPTGVDRVGLAYVRRYAGQAEALIAIRGVPVALTRAASERVFALLLGPAGTGLPVSRLCSLAAAVTANQAHPRPPAHGRGGTVLHTIHSGLEHARYFRMLWASGFRTIVMVHDLIPVTHPHYCRPASVRQHTRRMCTALRWAAGIVTNSQATLDALAAFARGRGMLMPPATVARLGVDTPEALSLPPQASGHPYFVMVGTIEPRKNHWFILHLWRELVAQCGNLAPRLVVIGRPGWKCGNELDMLGQCRELRDAVIHLPDCPDEVMLAQLRGARALLFPSFIEGYGLPLAEALSMGVPVLASNLAAFREVAGEVPDYLDPLDGASWLAHVRSYAKPSSMDRERQVARLAGFCAPTWPEHFAALDRFLDGMAP